MPGLSTFVPIRHRVCQTASRLTLPACALVFWMLSFGSSWLWGAEATPQEPLDLERLGALVRDMMLAGVPHEYENTKHWGRTKDVWDGLKVSLDGIQIKTKRRKKSVKHGTWKKYRAWLVQPRERLRVDVVELRQNEEGRVQFALTLRAPLGSFARLSEWRRDVQLYSFSAQAQADVALTVRGDMGFVFDFQNFPPDLLLDPVVHEADLRLETFRLQRLSDLSGPLVRELGDGLHRILQDEINGRQGKIVQEMNEQVEKNRHHLRLSVHELLHWDQIREALEASPGEATSSAH